MSDVSKENRITATPPPARPEIDSPRWLGSRGDFARPLPARIWWLLVLTHLLAIGLGALGAWMFLPESGRPQADPAQRAAKEPPGNRHVTLETFKKIEPGMTFEAVQELLGDEGQMAWERSREDFGRKWAGRRDLAGDPAGPEPQIFADFQRNKVTSKRANNLK